MNFLLPQGIGDSVWALHKVQAVRDALDPGGQIVIALAGSHRSQLETRAIDFVNRFAFVDRTVMRPFGIHTEPYVSDEGRYNYIADGWYDFHATEGRYCALMPNGPLERGVRLEDWLPQYDINWRIFDDFRISPDERAYADALHARLGDYAVFYPGPLHGNTDNGHNRNALWGPVDWLDLSRRIRRELGLRIAVVGAPYDAPYYELFIRPWLNGDGASWANLIGKTNIGQLYAVTSRAEFVISYQAGVGIVATYLGTPTAIWWRPAGDSISPNEFLSFDERMASGWVPPAVLDAGKHLPLYYGRHDAGYIMDEVRRRGWA